MKHDTQFTPTLIGATVGNGTLRGEYTVRGRLAHWHMYFELGTTSTVDGPIEFALPVSVSITNDEAPWPPLPIANGHLYDRSASRLYRACVEWDLSSVAVGILDVSTCLTSHHPITNTTPFVWSTGDHIRVEGVHLAADE